MMHNLEQQVQWRTKREIEAKQRGYKGRTEDTPKWWPYLEEFEENEFRRNHGESYTDLYCQYCHGAGWRYPVASDGTPIYRNVIPCGCKHNNG